MKPGRAHLMLRRNLPLWKPAETVAETISFCTDTGISEIIWKIDPEAFSHGFTGHELIRKYLPWLEKAREQSREAGVLFGVNPWVTLNHIQRGRYLDGPPPGFHWRINPDGSEALEQACPLSAGWREWFLEAYRLFATVKPDKLWLEDDFKTFSFDGNLLGCYCEKHLEAFSEIIGETITREQLVECLVAPGEPDPLRAKWLDFQGGIMVEVCREVERTVHGESPETRLGQMCSWSTDGRWWAESIKALAGKHQPLARTSLTPYNECAPTDWIPDASDFYKESACLPDNTQNCPELENFTYTPYAKSTRLTRLQIILSQVAGNNSLTMNLFDMLGGNIADDPRMGRMLKKLKPFIDGIASSVSEADKKRGVGIPFPKRYADNVYADAEGGFDLFRFDGEGWAQPLQGSGLSIVFNCDCPVSALTGQSVRSLDKPMIEGILAKGALLDGSATSVLCEMGYGDLIGVTTASRIQSLSVLMAAERDDSAPEASEKNPVYMDLLGICEYGNDRLYPLTPHENAHALSWIVDNEGENVFPAMVYYENRLGGRVAAYTFDLSRNPGPKFMNWKRRSQLQHVISRLCKGKIPLCINGGAWMIPVRRDCDGYSFIAVLNAENDSWDYLELTFEDDGPADGRRFELLDEAGIFKKIQPAHIAKDGPNIVARFDIPTAPLDAKVFRILPATQS